MKPLRPTMPPLEVAGSVQGPKYAKLAFVAEDFSRLIYGARRIRIERGKIHLVH